MGHGARGQKNLYHALLSKTPTPTRGVVGALLEWDFGASTLSYLTSTRTTDNRCSRGSGRDRY
jgi:hypothetical protein